MVNEESARIDRRNVRTGVVFGALSALPLALLFARPFSARGSVLQQIACDGAGLFYLGAGALVGAVAARIMGQRRASGGVGCLFSALAGAAAACALLVLLAPLALASEIDAFRSAQKTGVDLVSSVFALMFFGVLPATFAGAIAGPVLWLLVRPPSVDVRPD
jgi:hypothetical protein